MDLIALIGALQLGVPIALVAWILLARDSSRSSWLAKAVLAAAYCAAAAVAGLWGFVPWPTPYLLLALAGGAILIAYRRSRATPLYPSTPAAWSLVAACAIGAAVSLYAFVEAAAGHRRPPVASVDIHFPLRDGTFLVANGGSRKAINAHLMTFGETRFRDYRGQSYGVDIFQLNAMGVRARGIFPKDLHAYAIFGTPVYAPCSGTVLRVENGKPDMPPQQRDANNIPGNHVFMECAGVQVLIAHLQRGTVAVGPGPVAAGAYLGRVGNSGSTDEPHLHVHAQRAGRAEAFLSGDPVPVTFDGDYLVRNERVLVR